MTESFLVNSKVPVRNVWFLFLYAYDLAKFDGRFDAEIEESPDIKSLIARLLCHVVELRLRRNLSFGHRLQSENLTRVRGRIDVLKTKSDNLLQRGEIACRFEELTIDTPRNRLIRVALTTLSKTLDKGHYSELVDQTRNLAGMLERAGVSSQMPSRVELTKDQIARHESEDKLMISLARMVFELFLPTEFEGNRNLFMAQRNDVDFPKIFEKAIGNFYKTELAQDSVWEVRQGKWIYWNVEKHSKEFESYLPSMQTDIILKNVQQRRRIIIDTKFRDIFGSPHFDQKRFRSENIYQMYAYLRSQESKDDEIDQNTEGMLLYPTIGVNIDEAAEINGHFLRFATIDLSRPTTEIVKKLRTLPFEIPAMVA